MKKLLLTFLFLPFLANAQIITTIAGNGVADDAGDGGPATAAALNYPWGVAVDRSGNVFFTEYNNGKVRKIDPSGIITTVAGGGTDSYYIGQPATDVAFSRPSGIACDNSGNVYFAAAYDDIILKVNTAGNIYEVAGNSSLGYSGDGGPATAAAIGQPYGVTIDHTGNIYITDCANYVVRKIDTSGIITTVAGNGYNGLISGGSGVGGFSGDGGPATDAEFYNPESVAVDNTGNIFITDEGNYRVRKVNTSGIITTIAGCTTTGCTSNIEGYGPVTYISTPYGIVADDNGNVYFNSYGYDIINQITTTDTIFVFAGNEIQGFQGDGGPAANAEFNEPIDLTMDTAGNFYVADQGNNRIRKISAFPSNVTQVSQQPIRTNIYPNPANDVLHISLTPAIEEDVTYSIYSIEGVMMLKGNLKEGNNSISIGSLSAGMYMLIVRNSVGEKTVTKVVKE